MHNNISVIVRFLLNITETAKGIDCVNGGSQQQCSDPNSSCKLADGSYKCLCNDDHYDYSGTCTLSTYISCS